MTDLQYVYQSDIREKKSIGRGAFHKKCGSKSKKCTLPSDYLTRKEKAKLNSECKTYDMRKFYTYEEFKRFPDDIRLQYVNSLINRYNIGLGTIAERVFHVSNAALRKNLEKSNLLNFVNKSSKGSAVTKGTNQLLVDMGLAVEEVADAPESNDRGIQNPDAMTEAVEYPIETRVFANFHSMRIEMNDWDSDILDFLRTRFAGGDYHITITVDKDS